MAEGARRPAWAEVDLDAIRHNASALAALASPASLAAVVKADAYGHGAVPVARAALEGGATELCVALVDEGLELREAGVTAPVLVLSEPSPEAMREALACELTPTVYSSAGVALAASIARERGEPGRFPVEVKVDTGMHRVGAAPGFVTSLVREIAASGVLDLGGLWTHFAVADEPEHPATGWQLAQFTSTLNELAVAGLPAPRRVHAANSAGLIAWPTARFDMVRCGISLYGYSPSAACAPLLERAAVELRPALSLRSQVTRVCRLDAGTRVSYGLRRPLPHEATVATVPLGYADGIPRAYFDEGGEVLVRGRRRPLAGTVTMDQILVDCGDDEVVPGDEVVLIGEQMGERLTAEDWARRLRTIIYEVVTRIGPRVPRVYRSGRP